MQHCTIGKELGAQWHWCIYMYLVTSQKWVKESCWDVQQQIYQSFFYLLIWIDNAWFYLMLIHWLKSRRNDPVPRFLLQMLFLYSARSRPKVLLWKPYYVELRTHHECERNEWKHLWKSLDQETWLDWGAGKIMGYYLAEWVVLGVAMWCDDQLMILLSVECFDRVF